MDDYWFIVFFIGYSLLKGITDTANFPFYKIIVRGKIEAYSSFGKNFSDFLKI